MPDYMDKSVDKETNILEKTINGIRLKAEIPPGKPGLCVYCFEESQRLIRDACARCRDRRGLP